MLSSAGRGRARRAPRSRVAPVLAPNVTDSSTRSKHASVGTPPAGAAPPTRRVGSRVGATLARAARARSATTASKTARLRAARRARCRRAARSDPNVVRRVWRSWSMAAGSVSTPIPASGSPPVIVARPDAQRARAVSSAVQATPASPTARSADDLLIARPPGCTVSSRATGILALEAFGPKRQRVRLRNPASAFGSSGLAASARSYEARASASAPASRSVSARST